MFLRRRRQADAPNHYSHCMKFFITLLWSCSRCNALCCDPSFLRTQQRVGSLSHYLQLRLLRHGSLLCPIAALRSFRPPLRCITPRSQPLIAPRQGFRKPNHITYAIAESPAFPQATLQYSLGSIPLRFVLHSRQSCSVHRLPIIWLAGYPHFGCVQLANANCSCRTSISQSIAKLLLHSSAASVPFGKNTPAASYGAVHRPVNKRRGFCVQPLVGARSCAVPRSSSLCSLRRLASSASAPTGLRRMAKLLFCRRRFYRLCRHTFSLCFLNYYQLRISLAGGSDCISQLYQTGIYSHCHFALFI